MNKNLLALSLAAALSLGTATAANAQSSVPLAESAVSGVVEQASQQISETASMSSGGADPLKFLTAQFRGLMPAPATADAPAPAPAPARQPAPAPQPATKPAPTTIYANCTDVWNRLGRSIYRWEAGFSERLDGDNDGVGCERDPR